MIEFSQANTHKAFHVGHVRGTSIGESLARILEFGGNRVIRANYQGDSGMHVAKWIWCYKKYHHKEQLKKDESWIASIYVDAITLGGARKILVSGNHFTASNGVVTISGGLHTLLVSGINTFQIGYREQRTDLGDALYTING